MSDTTAAPPMTPPPADDAPHLLVVDDDRRIRALLSRYLSGQGYRVTTAGTALEARARLRNLAFDLIILDVMMPGESGLEFASWQREESDVPILMLTARTDAADRVRGLETGVDDYLAKPFEPKELSLRIASILRRTAARAEPPPVATSVASVRFGAFTFNLERGDLRHADEIIRLTDRERFMLRLLANAAGEPVSREELAGESGGANNERTVDVQINRLRRKIETDPTNPHHLQTARGAGYRLMLDR
ncbi:MAG: response regulator [Beijerinckiaceae bacterium]|nr:response regulator [Beijerinckiaceae bacterium]MDO9440717.1 response regulator [Beijerinckiaceae bacterium]